jgi:hypothetical protein
MEKPDSEADEKLLSEKLLKRHFSLSKKKEKKSLNRKCEGKMNFYSV